MRQTNIYRFSYHRWRYRYIICYDVTALMVK